MLSLRRGSEDQFQLFAAPPLEEDSGQHLAVSSGMPDSEGSSGDGASGMAEQIDGTDLWPFQWQPWSDGCNSCVFLLNGQQGRHRGSDARVLPLEIRSDDLNFNHTSSIALHQLQSNGHGLPTESTESIPKGDHCDC